MKSAIHSWLPCSPLGSGSSALVSLALSLPDRLPFALKTPLSPSSPSLLNELLILLPLSSPFILPCLGADFDDSAPDRHPRHLFLEFMEGGSLSNLVKRSSGGLEEPLVRRYARSIVQGLEYLHSNGIVHCDIKGQNILIGSSGVKVADFGAAKRIGSEEGANTSEFKGTPLWMAPEVVQGIEQGFPSDIWSLGCTVVELLQGRPPWGHISDIAAALYKLGCSDEAPPLPEGISDDARDFLLHCLQRDPKDRWTAAELLQHPFLWEIAAEDEVKHAQLSPRSTLDFFQSEASDSEDGSDFVPLCFPSVAKPQEVAAATTTPALAKPQEVAAETTTPASTKRQFSDAFHESEEHEWIPVKRAAGCYRDMKRVPFMKSPKAGYVHVRRGCDVSLEAAVFLRNRNVVG